MRRSSAPPTPGGCAEGGLAILDFGSQYTQLIARRLRELKVPACILPHDAPAASLRALSPAGLVLSGGPASAGRRASPRPDPEVLRLGLPVLGICYGMQLLACANGGRVEPARRREYGRAEVRLTGGSPLLQGLPRRLRVWMSHADSVRSPGPGFTVLARSADAPFAAAADESRRLYGVQFHPEVAHTAGGSRLLANFARRVCGIRRRRRPASLLDELVASARARVGGGRVVCGLSGGVDSAVAAAVLRRAVGRQLACVFVDTGLLREGDRRLVEKRLGRALGLPVRTVDASSLFLRRLAGVSDPERKRRIIGRTFVEVFEKQAAAIPGARFLAQGTLYTDVIESSPVQGPSAVIKTHHNVGGLPRRMRLELVEPLRSLFKDEVRLLGAQLGLPQDILRCHPFPGPGLAIRVLGPVTRQRLEILRRADAILRRELEACGWRDKVWQAFAVLLPVRCVGVMGDRRTYENAVVLRCVDSRDGMTADWSRLPAWLLQRVSSRIVSRVPGVNRVAYDVTSKPPATIEWE